MTLTEADQATRKGRITASLAAQILGEGAFGSPLTAWARITGRATEDISALEHIRAGNYLEPVCAQWWQDDDEQGRRLVAGPGTLVHPKNDWFAWTCDRLIVDAAGEVVGVWEGKSTNAFNLGEWEHGAVPLGYQIQLQLYLDCASEHFGRDLYGSFGALVGGNRFFGSKTHADVPRDREFAGAALAALRQWYERHVIADVQPDPTGRACDSRQLMRLHPDDTGAIVQLSAEAQENARKSREIGEQIAKLDEEKERLRNLVKSELGDATFGDGAGIRASWKRNAKGTRVLLFK